jgi:hypothetical protein
MYRVRFEENGIGKDCLEEVHKAGQYPPRIVEPIKIALLNFKILFEITESGKLSETRQPK